MPGSFASKMVDYFKKNMSSGANITVEGADVKAIKVDLTKSNPLASLERAHSAAHQEVMQEIGIGGAATVKKKSSRFSLSALAGRGSLWRPKTPKEVFQGLNEHSIFDSPLQEAISVLGDLSRTLDDDDRRLDALKHVITLLHEPELNAMRDVAGVAETETVKDDAVLQEWLGTRTSSLARISAMGSAKRFGRLLRQKSAANSIVEEGDGAPAPAPTSAADPEAPQGALAAWIKPALLTNAEMTVVAMLEHGIDKWAAPAFDALELDRLTGGNALCAFGWALFCRYGWRETLGIEPAAYGAVLRDLQSNYQMVPYHNSAHGTDVAHGTHFLLTQTGGGVLGAADTPEMLFACCLAALSHDIGHDGRNNGFHINTESEFAILYSDQSPLEHHHLATCFRILNQNKLFESWTMDRRKLIRERVIAMVLGTDFGLNMKIINQFKVSVCMMRAARSISQHTPRSSPLSPSLSFLFFR